MSKINETYSTSCSKKCNIDETLVTLTNGVKVCKPTCPSGTTFSFYYGCYECPSNCKLGCVEETWECYEDIQVALNFDGKELKYTTKQVHLDDQNYHLFIRAEPDVTDIYSMSRERFDALKISPADFLLKSPDFEGVLSTEKFDIVKNPVDFSLDFKIKFFKRPELTNYKLEIQFTGETVVRTETKRIPTGPSETLEIQSSADIHYLDGSEYYMSQTSGLLEMQKIDQNEDQKKAELIKMTQSQIDQFVSDLRGKGDTLSQYQLLESKSESEKTQIPNTRSLQSSPQGLIFENGTKTVEVRNIQYPTDEEVESASRLSSMLGFANAAQSDVVDAGLLVLGFTPFDPYFSLVKFAQGTKLVTRHRFIRVEHGRLFTAYQSKANQRFDRMSNLSFNEIYRASNGYKSKFTLFRSPITMFEYKTVHVVFYLLGWILKLIGHLIAERVAKKQKVSKFECYFVNYQQKYSFLVFQLIVIDLWFFGLMNIFHTDAEFKPFQKFLAIVCVLLSVFDIMEVIQKTRAIKFGAKKSLLVVHQEKFALEKMKKPEVKPKVEQTHRKASTSPSDNQTGDSVTDSAISLHSHDKEPQFDSSEKSSPESNDAVSKIEDKAAENDNIQMLKQIDGKEIDYEVMLRKFRQNLTIQNFSKSVLKTQNDFAGRTMILISNAQYLLRILMLHIILVSMHHLPLLQSILLVITEMTYVIHLVCRFLSNKHLNSVRFFIPHVLESLFVLAIQFLNLSMYAKAEDKIDPPSINLQLAGCWIVFIAFLVQYLNLVINIVLLVVERCCRKKTGQQKDEPYIEYVTYLVDTKDVHDVIRGSSAKSIPEFSVSAKSKKKPEKEEIQKSSKKVETQPKEEIQKSSKKVETQPKQHPSIVIDEAEESKIEGDSLIQHQQSFAKNKTVQKNPHSEIATSEKRALDQDPDSREGSRKVSVQVNSGLRKVNKSNPYLRGFAKKNPQND